MQLSLRRGGRTLQQALHEVDTAARAIQFITQQAVRRATGVAEPTVDALANNARGFLGSGISLQLRR
jgi:hypothetical protein